MRWTNDGEWSGDVFVWKYKERPEVIGCLLSGPGAGNLRYIWHEFHLLAEKPMAPATIQNGRRWAPAEGLKTGPAPDAPQPRKNFFARRLTAGFDSLYLETFGPVQACIRASGNEEVSNDR